MVGAYISSNFNITADVGGLYVQNVILVPKYELKIQIVDSQKLETVKLEQL